MTAESTPEIFEAALDATITPVAVTCGHGCEALALYANRRFHELCATKDNDFQTVIRQFIVEDIGRSHAFPKQPDWTVKASPLDGHENLWIWQAERRTGEQVYEKIAEWVTSTTLGDMGLFFFDPDGRLRAYNKGVRTYFPRCAGFPVPGGLFADQLDAILDHYDFHQIGDHQAQWRQELLDVYQNPGQARMGVTPAGRWALATATRMGDGSTFVFMNDITEFRERDQQIKLFMRNAMSILFSRRSTDGSDSIHFWGKSREALFGDMKRADGTWSTSVIYDNLDPRDLPDYLAKIEAALHNETTYSAEYRFLNPVLGEVRWIRESGWTIRDQDGVKYLDAMSFDITKSKLADLNLRESEERFRQFTELASDWYFETNADYQLTFLSDRFETVTGYPNDELMTLSYDDLIAKRSAVLPRAYAKGWQEYFEMWQRHESYRDVQLRIRHRNGKLRTVSMSGEPRYDADGNFLGYRGIGHDLTDLTDAQHKALESLRHAEEANAAKSSFIANVSHELRTPLNAILGFSSIMAEEVLGPMGSERYRGYAEDIMTSGQHLLSLVNDLLDMSRLEAGRFDIEESEVDLVVEIESAVHLLRGQAPDRQIDWSGAQTPIQVLGDQRAIRQILINLMSNAVKYSGEGAAISVQSCYTDDGSICVRVNDKGVGIAADDLRNIFEPFGRAKSDVSAEGTGLGLPLSRNLMRLHGGDLVVESVHGEGTTATMTFPPERQMGTDGRVKATA